MQDKENAARILLVDDDPHMRSALTRLLEKANYRVTTAPTGRDGLRLALEIQPDLVLLDVVLPDMDGLQVCHQIKSDPRLVNCFVVLFSGLKVASEEQAAGLEAGAGGYITRPISNRELLARVAALLRIKEMEVTLRETQIRHRELFNSMSSGVAVYEAQDEGRDFVIRDLNRAAERISRVERQEVIGESVREVFPGVVDYGLFEILQQVWRSGEPRRLGPTLYQDERLSHWAENYVYRLPSGEIVAVYDDVTERVQAEKAINALARFPAENPNPVLRLDGDGVVLYANAAARPLLETWDCKVDQPVPEPWRQLVADALRSGSPVEAEVPCDGRIFLLTFAPVVDDGYVNVYGLDVTERIKATETLRESEERYRVLVEHASDGIFIADPQGDYIEVNRSGCAMLGYTREEILSLNLRDLIPEQDLARKPIQFDDLRSGKTTVTERHLICRDGSLLPVEISGKIFPDGRLQGIVRDITERKRAEKALQESERLLDFAIQQMPVPVIIADAPNVEITRINRPAVEMLEKRPDDVTRIPLDAHREYWPTFYPDGTPYEITDLPLTKAIQQGQISQNVEIIVKKGEGERWISASAAPLFDDDGNIIAGIVVFPDITERKQAEQALRESQERYRALFAHSLNGIALHEIVLDAEGRPSDYVFLQVNQAFEELTGLSADEVVGQRVTQVLPGVQDTSLIETYGRVALTGEPTRFEQFFSPLGRHFAIAVFSPRRGEFATAFEDITERVKAEGVLRAYSAQLEDVVAERTQELQETQQALIRQEKLAVLGQLAGGVGHELRNPLGVISNAVYYLHMVLSDADETVREYLDIISSEVRNAEKIVADLLDFARVRSTDRQPVAIADLVASVLDKHPPPENVRLTRQVPVDLPAAYVDPRQMEQVLTNLTVNAYQAMPDGGSLTLAAKAEDEKVILSVVDSGPGIPAENMERIFEPLFTTKARGIGLGLAVSKNLVEANAGEIQAQSREGQGATFTVRLPTQEAEM